MGADKIIGTSVSSIAKIDNISIDTIASIIGESISSFTNTYSMNFDGVDDNIDTGLITLGTEYTLSFWFKNAVTPASYYTPLGANTLGGYVILLGATTGYWYYGDGTSARATVSDSAYTAAMSDTSNWHHLALVRKAPTNGTALYSDADVYLDGTLIFNIVDVYVGTTVSSVTNIGFPSSGTSYPYNGNLDEVSVFNSVLAIGDLWDGSGKPTDLTSLNPTAWYRMGD